MFAETEYRLFFLKRQQKAHVDAKVNRKNCSFVIYYNEKFSHFLSGIVGRNITFFQIVKAGDRP